MYPRFGDQTWITPYGLMLVAALIACWLYARRRATAAGFGASHVDLAVPLIFIISTLGAKFLTLISPHDSNIAGELFQTHFRFRLFGLLFIGFPVLLLYSRLANLSFRGMLDVFALPVVLWLVILRAGCFMAGCCWGDLTYSVAGLAAVTDPELNTQILTLPWLSGDWLVTAVSFPVGSFAYEQHLVLVSKYVCVSQCVCLTIFVSLLQCMPHSVCVSQCVFLLLSVDVCPSHCVCVCLIVCLPQCCGSLS